MQATKSDLARTQQTYSRLAGEAVEVQLIGGVLYALGSELATLRLFRKMPTKRQGFSTNHQKFYFSIED